MIETYRMLGQQREHELLREARRLDVGDAARGINRRSRIRLREAFRGGYTALLRRLGRALPRSTSTAE